MQRAASWLGFSVLCLVATSAKAQDIGHKLLGTVGIDAGVQQNVGVTAVEQLAYYHAGQLRDRNGRLVPVRGLELNAFGNALGVSGTWKWGDLPYVSASVAAPLAHIRLNSRDPRASVDRAGFGDLAVQPLKLGWRLPSVDVVAAYAFYVPTGQFEPRGRQGVGVGHWTHQASLGGALFFDDKRAFRLSVLASYDYNGKKRDLELKRGATVQLQGGAGGRLWQIFDFGVAGYALWQVTDDRGRDLPPILRGARDRVFGLGPEAALALPPLRIRLIARALWDIAPKSRPQGRIIVAALQYSIWAPAP